MQKFCIVGAVCLLLVAGAAALHTAQSKSITSSGHAWEVLPDDVIAVVHADIAELAGSEIYRTLAEEYSEQPQWDDKYREFVEATGFDFEEDLDRVTLAVGGDFNDEMPPFYFVVTGNFDRDRFDAYIMASDEFDKVERNGLSAYEPRAASSSDVKATLAWLDDRNLLVASQPDFARLVASARGNAPNASDSKLSGLLDDARGQLYLALMVPEQDASDPETVKHLMQSLEQSPMGHVTSLMFTVEADTGLALSIHADTASAEHGELLYDALNGYLSMGKMMAAQNPELGQVLEHLTLSHDGTKVSIDIAMSGDEIRAAIENSKGGAAITPGS